MRTDFLPLSLDDLKRRGWNISDIVLISGDAYVDHPSYGVAVIGRVLENAGFKVGIIAQPDWRLVDDFKKLGKPRLFFGITAGNMDSMVANYTANKRPRIKDEYSPEGKPGLRPDRATIVYANRVREAYGDIPVVIGGIEASLRRFAHYDWWDNAVRRSILLDSRADILVYGMGERQVVEIAKRLKQGKDLAGIQGTAIIKRQLLANSQKSGAANREFIDNKTPLYEDYIQIHSYEEVRKDKNKFNDAFRTIYRNQDPFSGKVLVQKHDTRYVIQYPPMLPLTAKEVDSIYDLPYTRKWHPIYDRTGRIPGFETVKFSIITHRGCCGECAFCALTMHQGKIIQSRSSKSILKEAVIILNDKDFKGTISDVGGPTANLYSAWCAQWDKNGACRNKQCLIPLKCKNLSLGYKKSISLLKEILALPKVKHVFIESGLRYDLLIGNNSLEYLAHICKYHISGQMKVAPEHSVNGVLQIMNKPSFDVYEHFRNKYKEICKTLGKKLYLVNYFISAHPGSTLEDALSLALCLLKQKIHPEQIQDFTPLPLTLSGCIYYTETHPFTGKKVHVPKTFQERKMHRALIQHKSEKSKETLRVALKALNKEHLFKQFVQNIKY